MKIEKGITLEQFVDWLNQEMPFFDGSSELLNCAENYKAVEAYNNRLKEPLTKDMFVNPYEKPTLQYSNPQYYECELMQWQEAENKVIFKSEISYSDGVYKEFICEGFNYEIKYRKFKLMGQYIETFGIYEHDEMSTLGDLFRATNGELEIKNFEI